MFYSFMSVFMYLNGFVYFAPLERLCIFAKFWCGKITGGCLKHHWGGGKTVSGFGLDLIRTLVSMETDSPHRVKTGKFL